MSTRSTIGLQLADGSIRHIYCHYDGYPAGVGKTLQEHYTTPQAVNALLDLGNLSALGAELGEKQDFDNPARGFCLAYHRDRGEDGQEADTSINEAEFDIDAGGTDYRYLMKDGVWFIGRSGQRLVDF